MALGTRDRGSDVAAGFRLGEWLVQPSLCRISLGERTVHLRPKVMDVLVCLGRRAGKVVSKQDLIDTVWARKFIADTALSRAVFELRRALDDNGTPPRYVETIAKRGYRLVALVEPIAAEEADAGVPSGFVVLIGDHEVRLSEGVNVIGRAPDARVRLDASAVSRNHARIVVHGATAVLEDLGSKNGTEVNGRRVAAPLVVADRAVIRIGPVTLELREIKPLGPTSTSPLH